jgi:5-formyltetrahydrofolate cyclo-ligase
MIVPGMAFDPAGRRLGRGGGFYDRYLARPDAAHIYKVGLCPPEALIEEVPAEAHDIVMNRVITIG